MKRLLLTLTLLAFTLTSFSQKKESHVIYNSKGKRVSYKKMLKTIAKKEVILFGESHDNPISHWLQYEVTSDLNNTNQLILGAEMFETDNQEILNEYLKDSINSKELDSLARLWPNYKTDYAPLVDFAKEKVLPFIATNIP
ncbi:MAG: ChaN family lipoprotein, partial [Chlorobi bacterium]|nr:ChaN family lipoprotein [Chlorobiota bacterium]